MYIDYDWKLVWSNYTKTCFVNFTIVNLKITELFLENLQRSFRWNVPTTNKIHEATQHQMILAIIPSRIKQPSPNLIRSNPSPKLKKILQLTCLFQNLMKIAHILLRHFNLSNWKSLIIIERSLGWLMKNSTKRKKKTRIF